MLATQQTTNVYSEAHLFQLPLDRPHKKSTRWTCKLTESFIGDYLVVPLTSLRMLKSESYRMENECHKKAGECAEDNSAYFSIRTRSGERLATLGLTRDAGHWRVDYCSGPSSMEVLEEKLEYLDEDGILQTELYPTEIYYLAQEVARLMNATHSGNYRTGYSVGTAWTA